MKIFFTFSPLLPVLEKAQEKYEVIVSNHELKSSELIEEINKIKPDALIVTLNQKFDDQLINNLPSNVKIIATTSVGFNHIDIEAATKRKIQVTNTPDVVTDCTADMAILLMLNIARRGREAQSKMDQGWGNKLSNSEILGKRLTGKTLGILGMGRIGKAIMKRAKAFDMKILYHNRRRLNEAEEDGAIFYQDFHEMLPHTEVLSLNAPATPETRNIMGKKEFNLLPKEAIFVNTARGDLVDEEALIESLDSHHLYGAGLDVYKNEPNFNKKLLNCPNVFLIPHMGTATFETRRDIGLRAVDNVFSFLEKNRAQDSINKL